MANNSGRITTLETELNYPAGELWLKDIEKRNSKGTAKRKRISLEQFDKYLIEQHSVADEDTLSKFDGFLESIYPHKSGVNEKGNELLRRFSIYLDDQGLAHSTIPHRFYAVRQYLNGYIVDDFDIGYTEDEDEYILDWLDKGTKTYREAGERAHWLAIDDIEELIDSAKNLKNALVCALLWNTGCRPSEIARMKRRDTYPEERRIRVKTSKIDDPDEPLYRRDVFWSRSMDRMMREWLQRGGRDSYAFADESKYLIVGYNTPSISSRQVNKIVRMAADSAGIQESNIQTAMKDGDEEQVNTNHVTPKTLRHSFAVHSVRGRKKSGTPSIDLERLRRLMGHTSIESTKFYLQFTSSDLRDVYDKSHPA